MTVESSSSADAIEVRSHGDGASWNRFVEAHLSGSASHLFEWREIVERTYRRRPIFLSASRGAKLTGVLPLVWMPGRLGGRRLVSMPYLDLGGPLALDRESRDALLDNALAYAEELGAAGLELREDAPAGSESLRHRFVLSLREELDQLWQAVGGKVRNQVRKAEKSGLVTQREEPSELDSFYAVFALNMRNLGSPVHDRRFFAQALDRLPDCRLYVTRNRSGTPVAGAIGIRCGAQLVVPWASSDRAARPLCPNHSLYWAILREAVAEGLESFDFGRSTVGGGTYRFKKQWGAEARPLGWRVMTPEASAPTGDPGPSRLDRVLVGTWRRLPLALANRLGPRVRGRLPQ